MDTEAWGIAGGIALLLAIAASFVVLIATHHTPELGNGRTHSYEKGAQS